MVGAVITEGLVDQLPLGRDPDGRQFMVTYIVLGGCSPRAGPGSPGRGPDAHVRGADRLVLSEDRAGTRSTCSKDARAKSAEGQLPEASGLFLSDTVPFDTVSLGLGLVLGTAGLPHITLMRFTVPTAKAARKSVIWRCSLIGVFIWMTTALVRHTRYPRAEWGGEGYRAKPATSSCRRWPILGGDLLLAIVAGVAFATILAVVAGLVISASGAVGARTWSNIVRRGRATRSTRRFRGEAAAFAIGALAIGIAPCSAARPGTLVCGLASAVAASANFPGAPPGAHVEVVQHDRAAVGVLVGISSIALVDQPDRVAWARSSRAARRRGTRSPIPRSSASLRVHRMLPRHDAGGRESRALRKFPS